MTRLINVIDLDNKYDRATFIGNHPAGDSYFALAIRRQRDSGGFYWCFYLGINDLEWSTLSALDSEDLFSFLSVPNDAIMVPQLVAEKYILTPPKYFVGIDMPPGSVGESNPEIVSALQHFIDSVFDQLKEDSHESQQTAGLVGV